MKSIFTFCCVLVFATTLWSQQDLQYTQFMHYKLGINPAYAGSSEGVSLTALARNQWMGIKGAPQMQVVSFNMPVWNNRVGIGANFVRQSVGVSTTNTFEAAYAYRLRVPRGYLNIGLMSSVRLMRADFTNLRGTQPIDIDNAVAVGIQSRITPNFGAGIYYDSEKFYFGISVPRLLATNIDLSDKSGVISREVPHFYLMSGVLIPLSDNVKFQPQALLKYVKGAPFDADVNFNLIFMDKFTTGISYRLGGSKQNGLGESVSLVISALMGKNLMLGLSYDATLSQLRQYNSGSVEAVLRYFINGKSSSGNFENGRFFF
jgi:type IX secretion system PorP/SprF family membrane protein